MYIYHNPNPLQKRVGDCVVRAISKITGESWEQVYIGVCMQGYLLSDMPSANHVWGAYIKNHGYRKRNLPDTCPDCYSVKSFCEEHTKGKYLLATGSHVVAVIDGNYYDTWDSGDENPIYFWQGEN